MTIYINDMDQLADIARFWRGARLEGIRLGLEAAAGEVWDGSRRDRVGATLAEAILDLDPETIAKENDQ